MLRTPPYRFLGLAYLLVLGLVLVTGGRDYYPAGAYPALFAAGAVAVGDRAAATLTPNCGSAAVAGRVDNGYGVENDEQGTPSRLCRDLRRPWSELWPGLHRFG